MIIFFTILVSVIAADQFLKYFAYNVLRGTENLILVKNLLIMKYTENEGAAFGILPGGKWLFVAVSLSTVAFIIYFLIIKKIKNKFFIASSALICAGGVSNVIDRIFRGAVIDYIKISFFPPHFNIADIAITVGAVFMIIFIFRFKEGKNKNG